MLGYPAVGTYGEHLKLMEELEYVEPFDDYAYDEIMISKIGIVEENMPRNLSELVYDYDDLMNLVKLFDALGEKRAILFFDVNNKKEVIVISGKGVLDCKTRKLIPRDINISYKKIN